jgi:hypothetical protein
VFFTKRGRKEEEKRKKRGRKVGDERDESVGLEGGVSSRDSALCGGTVWWLPGDCASAASEGHTAS